MKHVAVVTDGVWRKSVSAIRALGKAEYSVIVCGNSWFTAGFWSRFTERQWRFPTAADDSERFLRELKRRIRLLPVKPVLLPMEDATFSALQQDLAFFQKNTFLLFPPQESLEIAQNKTKTLRFLQERGYPVPESWLPESLEEFLKIASTLAGNEYVVKPQSGSGSVGIIYGIEKTEAFWRKHWGKYGPLLIQQRIAPEGEAQGVCLLFNASGECIASFAHKRLQQYPNSGGPSTDRMSLHNPQIVKTSISLLKELKWVGVAMVEWKYDPKSKTSKILEINPRFWGSLELGVRAGVNFPVLYAQAARGEMVQPVHRYSLATRCRWLFPGDILRYLTQKPSQRESLREFLRGLPGLAEEWDPRDLSGMFGTILSLVAMAFQPRFWKYLFRG